MRIQILWCLITCALPAQVVRIENLAPTAFTGWKRVTVDQAPPRQVGQVGTTLFVVGRQTGIDTRVVDVRVSLAPGAKLSLDLATATPAAWTRGGLPIAPAAFFGGWATIAGTPLQIVALAPDGAGWIVHLRARPSPTVPMLCVDLVVGPVEGRALALRVAKRMMQDGWTQSGADWLSRAQFPIATGATMPAADGSFNRFGMPLCAAVVLMHEPSNVRARAVWNYLLSDPNGSRRWMPPGVPQ